MFLDLDGVIYDYFGGAEDLANQKIRFVGDAGERLRLGMIAEACAR